MMRSMAEDGSMVFKYDMRWLAADGGGMWFWGMMLFLKIRVDVAFQECVFSLEPDLFCDEEGVCVVLSLQRAFGSLPDVEMQELPTLLLSGYRVADWRIEIQVQRQSAISQRLLSMFDFCYHSTKCFNS